MLWIPCVNMQRGGYCLAVFQSMLVKSTLDAVSFLLLPFNLILHFSNFLHLSKQQEIRKMRNTGAFSNNPYK